VKCSCYESTASRDIAEGHGLQESLSAIELHLAPDSRNSHANIVPCNDRHCFILLDSHQGSVHKEVEHKDWYHDYSSDHFGLVKSSSAFLETTAYIVFVLARKESSHGITKILGHFDLIVKINVNISQSL
jgi:hypothetical protein